MLSDFVLRGEIGTFSDRTLISFAQDKQYIVPTVLKRRIIRHLIQQRRISLII